MENQRNVQMEKVMLRVCDLFAKFKPFITDDTNFSKTIIPLNETGRRWELSYCAVNIDLKVNKATDIIKSVINSPVFAIEVTNENVTQQINRLQLFPISYEQFFDSYCEIEELLGIWINFYKNQ